MSIHRHTRALRIVSLVPSVTELLADLGLAKAIVGRTGFCVHPADVVRHIAKVGGTKAVNLEKIRALVPSHVVVNVDENEKSVVDALRSFVPHVVVTHPQQPADNVMLIDHMVAEFSPWLEASGATDSIAAHALKIRAKQLKDQLNMLLVQLQRRYGANPAVSQRVLYLIWREPWMTVARDTYISRMLAMIGWQTWPGVHGGDGICTPGAARYPVVPDAAPWLGQVQRVLLSSEPYSFGAAHIAMVQAWLPHAHVQCVDGEMMSWYGSRAVQGLAYLDALASGAGVSSA